MQTQKKVVLIGSHHSLLSVLASSLSAQNYNVILISEPNCSKQITLDITGQEVCLEILNPSKVQNIIKDAFAIILTPFLRMNSIDVISDSKSHSLILIEAISVLHEAKIINLSRLGAHVSSNAGILECFRYLERLLNGLSNVELHHLRTGYFLENFYSFIPKLMKDKSLMGFLPEEIPFFSTSYSDVVKVCLEILVDELNPCSIKTLNIRHESLVSPNQIARAIAKSINLESITYSKLSHHHARDFLLKKGYTELSARKTLEMYDASYTATFVLDTLRSPTRLTCKELSEFGADFKKMFERYERHVNHFSTKLNMQEWWENDCF